MNNQTSKTEFVLSSDGKIINRQITESEKELTAEMLASVANQNVQFWRHMFTHPQTQPITIGISKDTITLAAKLSKIRIKTNYTLRDGVLIPAFHMKEEPVFDITWAVPGDMKVYFVVELNHDNVFIAAHLPAIDENKRCYRLPLGNLYETVQICTGAFKPQTHSAQEAFNGTFEQFDKSLWNDDLESGDDASIVRRLFRFKPSGDEFTQLDATVKWQDVCTIVAPPILEFIQP
jgi:hypothetical protein